MRTIAGAMLRLAFAVPALAQGRTQVEIHDHESRSRGAAVIDERTGRVDTFERDSRDRGLARRRAARKGQAVSADDRMDACAGCGSTDRVTRWPRLGISICERCSSQPGAVRAALKKLRADGKGKRM